MFYIGFGQSRSEMKVGSPSLHTILYHMMSVYPPMRAAPRHVSVRDCPKDISSASLDIVDEDLTMEMPLLDCYLLTIVVTIPFPKTMSRMGNLYRAVLGRRSVLAPRPISVRHSQDRIVVFVFHLAKDSVFGC